VGADKNKEERERADERRMLPKTVRYNVDKVAGEGRWERAVKSWCRVGEGARVEGKEGGTQGSGFVMAGSLVANECCGKGALLNTLWLNCH